MEQVANLLGYLVRLAIGVPVIAGLLYFALRTASHFWHATAQDYAGRAGTPRIARKFPESIIITSRVRDRGTDNRHWALRVFTPVVIGIHDDGLELSMIAPFNAMCAPLFLPISEMEMTETWWALWPQPAAIRMKRAPEIDIIVSREVARWIRDCLASVHAGEQSFAGQRSRASFGRRNH